MSTSILSTIRNDIIKSYKSQNEPDYSFVQINLKRGLYKKFIIELQQVNSAVDVMDPNDDVCHSLDLKIESRRYLLQLSLVGRFATCFKLAKDGAFIEVLSDVKEEFKIESLLSKYGIILLSKEDMEIPINLKLINTEKENVCVYQALFSDTDYLPWN